MIKVLNKFARRVAGIDEKLIKECPKADRIWATHIGYMLSATFVILITISYLSIDYFNGAKIVFDVDTNMMKLEEGEGSIWFIFAGVAIAFVIASIIFMFDRAVFQSDWFVQTPYGIPQDWLQSLQRTVEKFFRILIRLSMSIAIAYALSSFLELRIYESQIIEVMQVDHLAKNKKIYSQIKQYAVDVDKEIDKKIKERDILRQRLEVMISSSSPWMMDENILRLDSKYSHDRKVYQKSLEKLEISKVSELEPIQRRLEELNMKREGIVQELDTSEMTQQAEEYGIDTMDVSGMQIKASGKKGNGDLSKILKKRVEQIRSKLLNMEEEIGIIKRELRRERLKYVDKIKALEEEHSQAFHSYQNTKEQYILRAKKDYEINAKKNRSDMESALSETTALISKLKDNRQRSVNNYTKMMLKNPQYIPMRDGPIVRLMALKKLSNEEENGEEMRLFSWIVKTFMIFLEVVPVIAKMFFSPPSVYAAMLQMQVASRVKDIFNNKNTGSMRVMKKQIKLEKMMIKLNHIRNQRIVSGELNPQEVREHMKYKMENIKKEAA